MIRKRTIIVALFGTLMATTGGVALASDNIVVAAQETEASVTPRSPRLRLVNIPPLEFALRAAIKCKGEPVSVTLSVADTYYTIRDEALADQRSAETTLRVPARQLALAASSKFCLIDDPESADELLVTGFATAHASLRCQADEKTSVHFASAPLKVRLLCDREEDQEPSEEGEER